MWHKPIGVATNVANMGRDPSGLGSDSSSPVLSLSDTHCATESGDSPTMKARWLRIEWVVFEPQLTEYCGFWGG